MSTCLVGASVFCLNPDQAAANTTAVLLARRFFLFAVFLSTCAVAARFVHTKQTRWKSNFTGLVMAGLVVTQVYHLSLAGLAGYPYDGVDVIRSACLSSSKGGRIPYNAGYDSTSANPCFCHSNATCFIGGDVGNPNATREDPTDCDASKDKCIENYWAGRKRRKRIEPQLEPSQRDCTKGQPDQCTREYPCTPCELETLDLWGADRCQTCSILNDFGDCHFVPDVGPYCWESPDTRKVVPCKQCCTAPLFNNGSIWSEKNKKGLTICK